MRRPDKHEDTATAGRKWRRPWCWSQWSPRGPPSSPGSDRAEVINSVYLSSTTKQKLLLVFRVFWKQSQLFCVENFVGQLVVVRGDFGEQLQLEAGSQTKTFSWPKFDQCFKTTNQHHIYKLYNYTIIHNYNVIQLYNYTMFVDQIGCWPIPQVYKWMASRQGCREHWPVV